MTKHKPRHSLLLNYDKVCPICKQKFYSRSLTRKYCSKPCSSKADKRQHREAHERWKTKNKENKEK